MFLCFSALTAIFFWPVVAHLSTRLIGPPENNLQDFWNLWYATNEAKLTDFFHTDLIRYPDRISLIYNAFTYPHTLVIYLITRFTGASHTTLTVLQNLSVLLSFPLSGMGSYYLARHFDIRRTIAVLSGFIFAFNPAHVVHAFHHMGVAQTEFFPFFALCWILTIERKNVYWLILSIVLYTLAALCSWYNVFYMAFFILFHAIYLRVRDDALPTGWRLSAPLLCFAGVAILLSPLIIPMMLQSSASAYALGSNEYVTDLTAFFTFPRHHLLYPLTKSIFESYSGNGWSATAYLGWINILILCALLWRFRKTQAPLRSYCLCGMIAFGVLALGDTLHVMGHDYSFIHLPHILFAHIPFLANVRTPSRILVLLYLFFALLIGHSLQLAEKRLSRRNFGPALMFLSLLTVLDYYPVQIRTTSTVCPAQLQRIAKDTAPRFGVLPLPLNYNEGNRAMFWQSCLKKPVSFSFISRELKDTFINRLERKNLKRQHEQLIRNQIKYIIFARPTGLEASYHMDCSQPLSRMLPRFQQQCIWVRQQYGQIDRYRKEYPVLAQSPDFDILKVY